MSESVLSKLQLLESCIDGLERSVTGVSLGVKGESKAHLVHRPAAGRGSDADQDVFFNDVKAIEFITGDNYVKRMKTLFGNYRGQLNYAHLYDNVQADAVLSPRQKNHIDDVIVYYMAEDIMHKITSWPRHTSQVSDTLVNELESFIRSYCKCKSAKMRVDMNEAITRKFWELPNDKYKGRLSDGFIRAFFAAFDISMYN